MTDKLYQARRVLSTYLGWQEEVVPSSQPGMPAYLQWHTPIGSVTHEPVPAVAATVELAESKLSVLSVDVRSAYWDYILTQMPKGHKGWKESFERDWFVLRAEPEVKVIAMADALVAYNIVARPT